MLGDRGFWQFHVGCAGNVDHVVRVCCGGVVAAGLGAAALYYADQQGWLGQDAGNSEFQTKLDLQAKEIAALQAALKEATEGTAAQFDALSANTVDLAPLETSIAALQSTDTDTTTSVQELATLLQATADRLAQLEVQPIPKAELPTEVVTAYEAQLTETLATIDGRFSEMQTSQGEVLTKLETELRGNRPIVEHSDLTFVRNHTPPLRSTAFTRSNLCLFIRKRRAWSDK